MPDWLWLALQAILAIIAVEQLRRHALPVVHDLQHPSLILDVWGPLALIIPMVFFVARIDNGGDGGTGMAAAGSTRGIGWMIIGAPIACGLIALGLAFIVQADDRRSHFGENDRSPQVPGPILACFGAGLIFLLLTLANDLTLWMGQCAFAVAAVLLWMNTPELASARSGESASAPQIRAGAAMTIALACAVGQGIASIMVSSHFAPMSGAMMIAAATMILASAARLAGPNATLRLGLWTATFGTLLGMGTISLAQLIPQAWSILQTGESQSLDRIATGLSSYIVEGLIMLMLAGGAFAQGHSSTPKAGPLRLLQGIGLSILILAALLAAWRLATL